MKTHKQIGIVGGGQLGMMLTEAATSLGFTVTVVDPNETPPATFAGALHIRASLTDHQAIRKLAGISDVVTFEIEHINTDVLKELVQDGGIVHPSPQTLETIKDKLLQHEFLRAAGIPTANFLAIHSVVDLKTAEQQFGYPFLLKTRHGGYDGRGNALIKRQHDVLHAKNSFGKAPLYAEAYIPFEKELAIMVVRSTTGEIKTYPVVQTIHEENILRFTLSPAPVPATIQKSAENLARKTIEHLQGAGVFGIEMFLTKDGDILINEIAPRVHNSGHYTIEACMTSQFEQHLRAIIGIPLGETTMKTPAAVMVNILGDRQGTAHPSGTEKAEALGKTSVHWYHKHETKPLRKMGHITVVGERIDECLEKAKKARKAITI